MKTELFFGCLGMLCFGFLFVRSGKSSPDSSFLTLLSLGSLFLIFACLTFFTLSREIDRRLRAIVVVHMHYAIGAATTLLACSMVIALHTIFSRDNNPWANILITFICIVLTIAGLILAIYSIKGYLDRPVSIFDVQKRLADIMENMNKENPSAKKFLLFMCEYPAIGALTCVREANVRKVPEDENDLDTLYKSYDTNLCKQYNLIYINKWHISFICPRGKPENLPTIEDSEKQNDSSEEENRKIIEKWNFIVDNYNFGLMTSIIISYGRTLGFDLRDQLNAAYLNKKMMENIMTNNPCKENGWKWQEGNELAAKYQTIITGTLNGPTKNVRVNPKEAIVFFALDSAAPIPGTVLENVAVSKSETNNLTGSQRKEDGFPMLAWYLTDRRSLNALVREAMCVANVTEAGKLFEPSSITN